VIAAAGDVACSPTDAAFNGGQGTAERCQQKAVSDLFLAEDFAAVLPLGDLQYEKGELANFQASYDQSWGRPAIKDISRPVVGNHEYETPDAAGYFDYFNGKDQIDGRAGNRLQGYYSFDIANWHLVALNSSCSHVPCGPDSAQVQWLKEDLRANPSSCLLAYWHHPRFTSDQRGGASGMRAIWQALHEARADVVLSGHHHGYERFARQDADGNADPTAGIREFVVGTGGKSRTSFPETAAANSGLRDVTTFGALRLTLRPEGYDWRFMPTAGGTLTDSGSDRCDGSTVDTASPTPPTALSAQATGPSEVKLTWKPSTDDDGVSGYRIVRDGIEIASVTQNRFTDASAQPGTTYRYSVIAADPSDNRSAASSETTITTPPPAPAP